MNNNPWAVVALGCTAFITVAVVSFHGSETSVTTAAAISGLLAILLGHLAGVKKADKIEEKLDKNTRVTQKAAQDVSEVVERVRNPGSDPKP